MFDDKLKGFEPKPVNFVPETVQVLNEIATLVLAAQHLPDQALATRKAVTGIARALLDALPRGNKRVDRLRAARIGVPGIHARAWAKARHYEPTTTPFDGETVRAMGEISLLLWASEQLLERNEVFKDRDVAKRAKADAEVTLAAIRSVSVALLTPLLQPQGRRSAMLEAARCDGRAVLSEAYAAALEVAKVEIAAIGSTSIRDAVAGPLRDLASRWGKDASAG